MAPTLAPSWPPFSAASSISGRRSWYLFPGPKPSSDGRGHWSPRSGLASVKGRVLASFAALFASTSIASSGLSFFPSPGPGSLSPALSLSVVGFFGFSFSGFSLSFSFASSSAAAFAPI